MVVSGELSGKTLIKTLADSRRERYRQERVKLWEMGRDKEKEREWKQRERTNEWKKKRKVREHNRERRM